LYLSKLEIFGFKSFPEKTTIELSSGVSAIVGPNGSGKSNIVDALRWVLGEQGDKALRSEKREDVVFSGTSKRKPLSVAEVALTIINNKNILETPYSEVQIARRFFRSGETEYYLNGIKVRLKDIKSLFANTGIGPDAYSVIELKMIETILSHVKNERRKMFEEASGIVTYKQNRDLTFKKLESVKETLTRVNDIIREKQRNVSALEKQAKKNEEAKIVFNDLRLLEIIFYKFEYDRLQNEIKEIRNHEQENIDLEEKLKNEVQSGNEKYDILQPEIKSLEENAETIEIENDNLRDDINNLEKNNLVISEKIKNLQSEITRLNDENENLETSFEKNIEKETDLDQKVNVLKRTLEMSEVSLKEKKTNVENSIRSLTEKKNDIADLGLRLKESNTNINSGKNEYEKSKIILEKNLERMKIISDSSQKALNDISRLETERNDLEKKIDDESSQKKTIENEYRELTDRKNILTNEYEKLKEEATELTINIRNKENKISYLTNLIETLEDYAEGIKYLKKDSEFDFVETVLDTIDVDDKFKIAVETALGEITNYLIVSDSRYLNKLIQGLNDNDKGKVTFILNDKLEKEFSFPLYLDYDYYSPDFINENGVYGFADKLIKFNKNEYEFLIRYLLDEYIIVEDIDTAFKLSKDNYYKFITLDGDIITQSVVRAGGKTKEENLRFGREKQIIKIKEEVNNLQNIYNEQLEKIQNIEKELENINDTEIKKEIDKFTANLNDYKNSTALLNFKIAELNKKVTENDTIYNSLKTDNINLSSRINELIEEITKLENNQANIDKELDFITNEFNEIESKHSENQTDYNSFLIEFNRLKNELKNEETSLTRTQSSKEFQEKQITKNKLQISNNEKTLELLDIDLKNNKIKIEEYNTQKNFIQKKLTEITDILDTKKEQKEKLEIEQRGKRQNLEKVTKLLVESKIHIREYEIKSAQHKEYIDKKYEMDLLNITDELSIELDSFKPKYTNADKVFDVDNAFTDINNLTERLKKLGGGFQQILWEDFQTEKEELEKMIEQRNDLHESEKSIRKTIEKINSEAREKFLETFEKIRQNFINIFKELFQEGDESNLKLVFEEDEDGKINDDPLEAKIEITAKPRGKRPTSIELLSGGEKTLTAIALLFAIYLVKPSPFCVLDEVDAPLDVANLGRFNRMIRKFSENTQFILITHNERTMETVDTLYGVTMQEPGVTTIVETRFKESDKV